jgi:tetratricopeptide (TPR) repeat protein
VSGELVPGSRIGGFEVVAPLGRGGMGVVYEAKDAAGRHVALKLLPATLEHNLEAIERFEREARRAASVSHANVVRIHGVVASPAGRALVMELVRGESLQQAIARRGRLPWQEVAALGAKLARALAAVHGKDLVHRDVKPANVLLCEDGEPKLADFGLARRVKTESVHLTRTGEIVGSFAFLPPEQANDSAQADGRADLYGLGATIYTALTGKTPFEGEGMALALKIMDEPPPSPRALAPDVPAALDELVRALLAKKPGERPGALEVASALEALGRGARSPFKKPVARSWAPLVVGLLLAAAVLALFVTRRRPAPVVARAFEPLLDALDPESPGIERALAAARAELATAPGGAALAWRIDLVEAETAWLRGDLARVASLTAALPADARADRLAALWSTDAGPPAEALAALAPVASASELLARAFALVRLGRAADGLAALQEARRAGGDRFHARAALVLAAAGLFEKAEAVPLGEITGDVVPVRAAILAAHELRGQSWADARPHVRVLAATSSPWRDALVAPVLSLCRARAAPESKVGSELEDLEDRFERCSMAFELAATLSPGEVPSPVLSEVAYELGLRVAGTDVLLAFRAHRFVVLHATPAFQDLAALGLADVVSNADSPVPFDQAVAALALALEKTRHPEHVVWKEVLFYRGKKMFEEARRVAYGHPGYPLVDLYAASFRLEAGELDEARKIYERLRVTDDFYPYETWFYHRNLALLLQQPGASREDLERAAAAARRAGEVPTELGYQREAWAVEGDILDRLGRFDEAVLAWRKDYDVRPRSTVRRRIARLLLAAGKRDEALAELEKDPGSADLSGRVRKGEDVMDELLRTQGNAADEF